MLTMELKLDLGIKVWSSMLILYTCRKIMHVHPETYFHTLHIIILAVLTLLYCITHPYQPNINLPIRVKLSWCFHLQLTIDFVNMINNMF